LSERELEVLRLLAAGYSNPEIAGQLYISLNTVKSHLKNIYAKLGVTRRGQATARARDLQLL
jgi:LuxR family maltose regulon positive regulatory protein